jgi:hypothetical protein
MCDHALICVSHRKLRAGALASTSRPHAFFECLTPTLNFALRLRVTRRGAHLAGEVAKALMAKAPDLFSKPPKIEKLDMLATKPAR